MKWCLSRRSSSSTTSEKAAANHYPVSAIPPLFEFSLVRLEDVLQRFSSDEMRRKRQLTLQFEVLFLCFFIPFSLYFIPPFDQGALQLLNTSPFPLFPPSSSSSPPVEYPNSVRQHTLAHGYFSDETGYWQWMNNVVYNELFLQSPEQNAASLGETRATPNSDKIISQPVIVGKVRVRQLRVKPQPCPLAIHNSSLTCYPTFSPEVEETAPLAGIEYVANTGELPFVGKLATYPASGYYLDLDNTSSFSAAQALLNMRDFFSSKAVACVILTLTTFDGNSGLVSTIRVGVEFTSSGNTILTQNRASRAVYYRTDSDLLTMQVLQVLVLVAELWYVCFKLNEIGMFRTNPLSRMQLDSSPLWLAIDALQLALVVYISYLCIPFLFLDANQDLQTQVFQTNFFSGRALHDLSVTVLELAGVVVWLGGCIVFKSTERFRTMRLWHQVLNRIAWDGLLFFAFIAVFCLGFVLCGWVVFGSSLAEYSSFGASAFTVMNMLVMIVNYAAVGRLRPFGFAIAPIFFVPFLLYFTWYLYCVLVGIVYLRYKQEKIDWEERKLRERKWVRAAGKLGARRMTTNAQQQFRLQGSPTWYRWLFGLPARAGFASNHHVLEKLQAMDPRKQCFVSLPKLVSLLMSDKDYAAAAVAAGAGGSGGNFPDSFMTLGGGGGAYASSARFAEGAYASSARFAEGAYASSARFAEGAYASSARFAEEAGAVGAAAAVVSDGDDGEEQHGVRSSSFNSHQPAETGGGGGHGEDDSDEGQKKHGRLHRILSRLSSMGGGGARSSGEAAAAAVLPYHPLVVQAACVFQRMYLIPGDKPEVLSAFYKLEESMIEGEIQAKRACLLRLQTSMASIAKEAGESKQAVLDRLASLRAEQKNLRAELWELRKILSEE